MRKRKLEKKRGKFRFTGKGLGVLAAALAIIALCVGGLILAFQPKPANAWTITAHPDQWDGKPVTLTGTLELNPSYDPPYWLHDSSGLIRIIPMQGLDLTPYIDKQVTVSGVVGWEGFPYLAYIKVTSIQEKS